MKRSVMNQSLSFFLFSFLIAFCPFINSTLTGQWQIETAGNGSYGSIAVDSTGKVYIAYINSPYYYGDVVVAVREGGQWSHTTLPGNGESNGVSMALDGDGYPHIIYAEGNPSDFNFYLKYITLTELGWSSPETIVTTETDMMAWSPTIQIDKNDQVHITYLLTGADAGTGEIYYLTDSSGDWESTKLNDKYQNPALYDVSMVLDSEGNVHVVSYFSSLGGPGYMTNSPDGQWSGTQLIQLNWFGGQLEGLFIDISMDPDNNPHVSYVGSYDGSAVEHHMYATKDGQSAPWDFQKIDDGSLSSAGNAIACDPDGVEHIAYYHLGSDELRYSMNFSGSWPHETIASLTTTDSYWVRRVEIISDQDGYVHISYQDDDHILHATNRIELPAPNIVLSPTSMAFGTVDTGLVVTKTLYIKNEGVLDLHLSDITLVGGDSAEFSLDHLCDVIIPDDSCAVHVSFEPLTQGEKQTSLKITSDDPDTPVTVAAITGRTPYPVISVDPVDPVFDAVEVGGTDTQILSIVNSGDAELEIDSLRITGDDTGAFSVNSSCVTISQSGNCDFQVVFEPGEVGTHTAALHIYSNDPYHTELTVSLEGRTPSAQISIQADVIDFGSVPVGNLATAQLVIENTGERQLNISSISIGGTNADLFRCGSSCGVISSGGLCTLDLTFIPGSAGQKSALLSIASNDPYNTVHSIILTGAGGDIQNSAFIYRTEEDERFYCMDTLSSGNIILGGGTGASSCVVVIDQSGNIVWQKNFTSGSTGDAIHAVRELWDHSLIVAGTVSSHYHWIARLDPNGEIIWQKQPENDYYGAIHDVILTSDSNLVAVGATWPLLTSDTDMWIGKFDPDGTLLWQKRIGKPYGGYMEPNFESGLRAVELNNGNYIVAGYADPRTPSNVLIKHPDGGYLYGGDDALLWKFSPEGDILWQKKLDPYGGYDFWLCHIGPDDVILWQRSYPLSNLLEYVFDLALTPSGDIVAVGSIISANTNNDMRVMKLTKSGDIIWQKKFAASGNQEGYKVLVTSSGSIVISGYYATDIQDEDGWFVQLDPAGNLDGCASNYLVNTSATGISGSNTLSNISLPFTNTPGDFITAGLTVTDGTLAAENLCSGIPADVDRDGVTDSEESGPDGLDGEYDGNSDGLPDSQQANAASLHSFDGSAYLCLETDPGLSLQDVSASDNPSPEDQPEDFVFEMGFFEFTITGLDEGGEADLTLHIPPGSEPESYYKYAATADNNDPHWYEFLYDGNTGAEISSGEIVLHFVDGERGDEDLNVNGQIRDIGGPAMPNMNTGLDHNITGNPQNEIRIYPNPSAGMAKVSIDLYLSGHVLIEYFDPLGRKVGTLVDQYMTVGEHILWWNTGLLPAGNYFLVVRTGDWHTARKLVVIR